MRSFLYTPWAARMIRAAGVPGPPATPMHAPQGLGESPLSGLATGTRTTRVQCPTKPNQLPPSSNWVRCYQPPRLVNAVPCSRISLTPQKTTAIMPHVGIGGSIVVESRKNGQFFRGIIWWNYLVGSTEFSRPPARPPVAAPPRAPPRALGSAGHRPRRTAKLHSPPARSAPRPPASG
jgi:hypothetical protein